MKARIWASTGIGVVLATVGALLQTPAQAPRQTGITALLQDLNQAGIRFKDLQTTQSSLQDIFVDLVRQSR